MRRTKKCQILRAVILLLYIRSVENQQTYLSTSRAIGIYSLIGWQKKGLKKLYMPSLGRLNTTPEEFENGGFTLKMHHMFFVHTTPEEFENSTITGHFEFLLSQTRAGKCPARFQTRFSSLFPCSLFTLKREARVF